MAQKKKRVTKKRARKSQPITRPLGPVLVGGASAPLTIATLVQVLCAAHLSSYVEGPFQERGGVMLVGPPSVLKSTLLGFLDRNYPDAVALSDINARALGELRDQIAAKAIRTLVLPEYAKLWDRHPYTAKNVEGTLRALVGEGFTSPSFEDSRINRLRARVSVLSGMVPKFQVDHFKEWEDTGFNRRFLWPLVRLKDPHLLEKAVVDWEQLDFKVAVLPLAPVAETIPNLTTKEDRAEMRAMVKYQPGGAHATQIALLVKILAVFKWWYRGLGRREKDAVQLVRAFGQTLGKEGAELVI